MPCWKGKHIFGRYAVSQDIPFKKDVLLVWQLSERHSTVSSRKGWHFFCMEEDKICCFFGHRKIQVTEKLYATTTAEILKSVNLGCRVFYFGGYGEFDELCYKIVSKIKKENPTLNITRVYCVPQERYLRKNSPHFNRANYENVIYLSPAFEGWYKSIYFRNCAMIDKSSVAFFTRKQGRTVGRTRLINMQ